MSSTWTTAKAGLHHSAFMWLFLHNQILKLYSQQISKFYCGNLLKLVSGFVNRIWYQKKIFFCRTYRLEFYLLRQKKKKSCLPLYSSLSLQTNKITLLSFVTLCTLWSLWLLLFKTQYTDTGIIKKKTLGGHLMFL